MYARTHAHTQKKRETALGTSNEVGLEVNVDKTMCI